MEPEFELRIDAANIYMKLPLSLEAIDIAREALKIAECQLKKNRFKGGG